MTWSHLFDQLSQLDLSTADVLSQGFLGLINGMLSSGKHDQARGRTKLHAMEQYLQAQLRGDISIGQLCQYFKVSRATVFRLFKEHGGVNRYIDALRLERCYSELKHANPQVVTIGEIAAGWGYHDPSRFNRKFRKQFDLPPSKVLGTWFHADTSSGNSRVTGNGRPSLYRNFRRWMDKASGLKQRGK